MTPMLSTLNLSVGEIIIVLIVAIPLIGTQVVIIVNALRNQKTDPAVIDQAAKAQQQAQTALQLAMQHGQQLQALAMATPAPGIAAQPATLPSLTAAPPPPPVAPTPYIPPGAKP